MTERKGEAGAGGYIIQSTLYLSSLPASAYLSAGINPTL